MKCQIRQVHVCLRVKESKLSIIQRQINRKRGEWPRKNQVLVHPKRHLTLKEEFYKPNDTRRV